MHTGFLTEDRQARRGQQHGSVWIDTRDRYIDTHVSLHRHSGTALSFCRQAHQLARLAPTASEYSFRTPRCR